MMEIKKKPRGDRKPCTWPHAILDREQERELADVIARYENYIAFAATEFSEDDVALAEDLAQEARILLWKLGAKKVAAMDETLVRVALLWRMIDVWREQWSRGGGDRKIVIHLQAA